MWNEGEVDWAWLDEQVPVSSRAHVRHIRLTEPMVVAMNGKTGEGVVLKPAAPDRGEVAQSEGGTS
jgi:hypothetical protein